MSEDDAEIEEEPQVEQPGETDPYAILGVERNATQAQIRVSYLQRVREHPPERDPDGFKRVREAYEILRFPRKRAELALLEFQLGQAEFDLDRLQDLPPPAFPQRFAEHLLAIAVAELDAAIDAEVAEARQAGLSAFRRSDSTSDTESGGNDR